MIFAVPIPEEYESVGQELQRAVEQAVQEAEVNGVSRQGKEATPWLLKRVGELTSGKSLRSSRCRLSNKMRWRSDKFGFTDVALIENTATVGKWNWHANAYMQSSRHSRRPDCCCLCAAGRGNQCVTASCRAADTITCRTRTSGGNLPGMLNDYSTSQN